MQLDLITKTKSQVLLEFIFESAKVKIWINFFLIHVLVYDILRVRRKLRMHLQRVGRQRAARRNQKMSQKKRKWKM